MALEVITEEMQESLIFIINAQRPDYPIEMLFSNLEVFFLGVILQI